MNKSLSLLLLDGIVVCCAYRPIRTASKQGKALKHRDSVVTVETVYSLEHCHGSFTFYRVDCKSGFLKDLSGDKIVTQLPSVHSQVAIVHMLNKRRVCRWVELATLSRIVLAINQSCNLSFDSICVKSYIIEVISLVVQKNLY